MLYRKIKNYPNKFKDKIIIINPLVREKIYKYKCFTIKMIKNLILLIVGGSQGASIFNDKLKNQLIKLSKKKLIKSISTN